MRVFSLSTKNIHVTHTELVRLQLTNIARSLAKRVDKVKFKNGVPILFHDLDSVKCRICQNYRQLSTWPK